MEACLLNDMIIPVMCASCLLLSVVAASQVLRALVSLHYSNFDSILLYCSLTGLSYLVVSEDCDEDCRDGLALGGA